MKKIFYLISLGAAMLFTSCEKPLETYDTKPAVYFNEAGRLPAYQGEVIKDSTLISFSLLKNQDIIMNMVITATGTPSDQDRPYKLAVSPTSTAKEGVHYQILDKDFSIKKGETLDTIRVKFFRTPDMQTNTYLLSFNLESNDNFSTSMNSKKLTNGNIHSFVTYRFFVNDIVKKPARWLDTYLGTFTRKKLFLMIEILGVDPSYMDTAAGVGEIVAWGKFMQRYLNEQASAGNPIYEDNGTLMVMGPSSQ